ncbi:Pvc16 family protein [Actinophytocola glycyrrhizae]|uniref:Pvc16 family protein n=1 Tax=Actinophytocola glycyrrhizae TaxID=2044873 RepID=A0ABV9S7U5_9PSEU
MLRDIDTALTALLTAAVPGAPVQLGAGGTEHGLRVLLHDVREEPDALAATWQDEHDADGRVVARRPPVRRYRLRYLVFAVAADRAAEHDWLGRVLVALAAHQVVPTGLLPGPPAPLQVAPPGLSAPAHAVLAAIGARPLLEVAVLAPCVQPALTGLPSAPDTVDLGVTAGLPHRAPPGRRAGPAGRRIREGGRG